MQYFSLSQWEDCWFLIEQEKKQGKILDTAMIHNFKKQKKKFFFFCSYFTLLLIWWSVFVREITENGVAGYLELSEMKLWSLWKVLNFCRYLQGFSFSFFANLVRKNACQICLFRKRMLPRYHIWNWNRKYRVFVML